MPDKKINLFLGCAIAPLVNSMVFQLLIIVMGIELALGQYGLQDIQNAFGHIGIFLFIGAPIAYIIFLTFGLPTYFLLKKCRLITFASVTLGGAMMNSLPLIIFSMYKNVVHNIAPYNNPLIIYLALIVSGFVVGVVFWFTAGLHRHYK
ncbi:hypothetical protein [Thalassotalea sp. PLHSN55]|uniref:hypothetical protein n=1 Tax=Thalassotalea sp. PLHSN55 TaxID=3435888 RepID=UPI003F84CACF